MEAFETFEHAGFTCELHYDEDGSHADPRQMDQLGTMVCWHPDYVLGDEQFRSPDGRGAVASHALHSGQAFETEHGRTEVRSMESLERYLRLMRRAVVVLPLYLLDHSGISMTAGSNTVGRGDTACGGRDSWGNPHGWDTTMVGFIYTTAERCAELCGTRRTIQWPAGTVFCPECGLPDNCGDCDHGALSDEDVVRLGGTILERGLYAPPDWEGDPVAWVAKQLRDEVDQYSAFISGQVYGYIVRDEAGEVVGSCWGFLPDTSPEKGQDGLEYVRQEARAEAESERDLRAKRRRLETAGWAIAHGLRGAMPV